MAYLFVSNIKADSLKRKLGVLTCNHRGADDSFLKGMIVIIIS